MNSTRLLVALVLLISCGVAVAEVLQIGVQASSPPFSYIDGSGERAGFDIDIAKALCEEIEAQCEFIESGFAGLMPRLQKGEFDAVVGSLSITDERLKVVDFSNKYHSSPARYVARSSRQEEIEGSGLGGKFVGVKHGTTFDDYLRANYAQGTSIRRYGTLEEALLDLVLGRLDIVLGDSIILRESFLNDPVGREYALVGPALDDARWFGRGAGIAVRKGNRELVERLNAAIDALRRNGRYQAISDSYFGYDIYGETPADTVE